jgi:hypothetical protein
MNAEIGSSVSAAASGVQSGVSGIGLFGQSAAAAGLPHGWLSAKRRLAIGPALL